VTIRDKVIEFHKMVGQPVLYTPTVPPEERVRLRLKLICEEFFELLESTLVDHEIVTPPSDGGARIQINSNGVRTIVGRLINESPINVDLIQTADALADLEYVIVGSSLEMGIDLDAVVDEVHRSNLTKSGGGMRPDGKIKKGPDFRAPDIEAVLEAQGMQKQAVRQ
jgi:predicted HAD superfamily Cof-like phosphohydrolase